MDRRGCHPGRKVVCCDRHARRGAGPNRRGQTVGVHRLVVLSDTHLPTRSRDLPAGLWAALDDLGPDDVAVHAGDWVDEAALDLVLARLAPAGAVLLACWGNNDGPPLRARLPEVARATIGGVRVAVVHETGPATGREARAAAGYGAETDLLVFGHSHIPWDTVTEVPGGRSLRLLNPGSPTDRRRQPFPSYLTAVLCDGAVSEVRFHRLPVRGGGGRVVPQADGTVRRRP